VSKTGLQKIRDTVVEFFEAAIADALTALPGLPEVLSYRITPAKVVDSAGKRFRVLRVLLFFTVTPQEWLAMLGIPSLPMPLIDEVFCHVEFSPPLIDMLTPQRKVRLDKRFAAKFDTSFSYRRNALGLLLRRLADYLEGNASAYVGSEEDPSGHDSTSTTASRVFAPPSVPWNNWLADVATKGRRAIASLREFSSVWSFESLSQLLLGNKFFEPYFRRWLPSRARIEEILNKPSTVSKIFWSSPELNSFLDWVGQVSEKADAGEKLSREEAAFGDACKYIGKEILGFSEVQVCSGELDLFLEIAGADILPLLHIRSNDGQ